MAWPRASALRFAHSGVGTSFALEPRRYIFLQTDSQLGMPFLYRGVPTEVNFKTITLFMHSYCMEIFIKCFTSVILALRLRLCCLFKWLIHRNNACYKQRVYTVTPSPVDECNVTQTRYFIYCTTAFQCGCIIHQDQCYCQYFYFVTGRSL